MSFLKGTLGMIGGGMGAMALLNEGKAEQREKRKDEVSGAVLNIFL